MADRAHARDRVTLGDCLAGLAIPLLGVGAFVGAAFLNLMETNR